MGQLRFLYSVAVNYKFKHAVVFGGCQTFESGELDIDVNFFQHQVKQSYQRKYHLILSGVVSIFEHYTVFFRWWFYSRLISCISNVFQWIFFFFFRSYYIVCVFLSLFINLFLEFLRYDSIECHFNWLHIGFEHGAFIHYHPQAEYVRIKWQR